MANPAKTGHWAGHWKSPVRTDAFIFRAMVNTAGYQWAKGIIDRKPHLIPRLEPGTGIKEIEPPKGVFAEFANLKPTECDIRGFAGKYGALFRFVEEQDLVAHDGRVSGGSSLKRWQVEIAEMRALVNLWEHIRYRKTSELAKIIRWQKVRGGHKEVGYRLETPTRQHDTTLAHSAIHDSGFSRFSDGDLLLPARCALQIEINLRLAEHPTVPRLAWTPDSYQRIIFEPPNLLAAMWLRFAQAVTGQFQLRQCVVCGEYFQIGPGGRRADSTTCGDACRQKQWRNLHEK